MLNQFLIRVCLSAFEPTVSKLDGGGAESSSCGWRDNCKVTLASNGKFEDEVVCQITQGGMNIFSGVLLNRNELAQEKLPDTLSVVNEYPRTAAGRSGICEWRGSYFGFGLDIPQREVVFFVDHLGNMPLYYYSDSQVLVVSDSVFLITSELRECGINITPSMVGAYSLLTYAYMLTDNTPINGIKRVLPGTIIRVKAGEDGFNNPEQTTYYTPRYGWRDISLDRAVDTVDQLFLQAVERQHHANYKYDYDDYSALSAGLDSRMTTFALDRIGVPHLVAYTYSQTLQKDSEIPERICHDKAWRWIFAGLDGGWDLIRDIDCAIYISNATNYYTWASQLGSFLDAINLKRVGLVHTGVIGDVVVSSYLDKLVSERPYRLGDGAYSTKLIDRLAQYISDYYDEEVSYEHGVMMNRGINGVALGYSLSFNRVGVGASPFMDIDFFDYCMSLPTELRKGHRLYYKWVMERYPDAAKYPHNGLKISDSSMRIPYKGRSLAIDVIPSLVRNKLASRSAQNSMNPIEWWYQTNELLRDTFDSYYRNHCDALSFNRDLQRDTEWLFTNGTALEKTLCMTLVGTYAMMGF